MDPNPYNDVGKSPQSTFYGALSGSVCFPMPLMYNPMNSYPFMSTPFLPMHHPMLSGHGLQDSHVLPGGDSMQMAKSSEDLSSRALAYLQSRYQTMGKCFLPPARKSLSTKYCSSLMDIQGTNECNKLAGNYGDSAPLLGSNNADKDCYLSSPGTEVEEPDSSGKCSTDVPEQKLITRWTCDSSQPPVCPICGRTISLSDVSDHYHMELDKLNELIRKKEWMSEEEEQVSSPRFQSYHDVEKRCPEFRKETYLRVRANRINRLGGSRTKRPYFDDSWKLQRMPPLLSPKQENVQDETSTHQSMLMLELTVQQLSSSERRTETENRSAYHEQSTEASYHEDQNKAGLADSSSCNSVLDPCSGDVKQQIMEEDNQCSSVDIKCQVCLESYRKPVVSVCCWHVHCEVCWLKALGNKRVCPQCETITSPADLRRIHL